jgi:hypothetical protein
VAFFIKLIVVLLFNIRYELHPFIKYFCHFVHRLDALVAIDAGVPNQGSLPDLPGSGCICAPFFMGPDPVRYYTAHDFRVTSFWTSRKIKKANMSLVRKESRWLAFVAGMIFLNFPLLNIWNKSITLFGFPLLFVALFVIWGLFILLTYLLTKKAD